MKTGFWKLHIAAVLAASIGGGVLYASESALSYDSAGNHLRSSFVSHAEVFAESDAAFASLEYEIDFVDSLLMRFGGNRNNVAGERAPQQDAGLSREFLQQLDAQTNQRAELMKREDELLYGGLSSIINGTRSSEFRAASPLRSQYAGHVNGERSGAQTSSSSLGNAAGLVRPWTPRVSLAIAAPPGIGRTFDVRAGLHLHAIRNGCISKEVQPIQPLLTDLLPPLRSPPLSFSPSLSPSFHFLRPVASPDRLAMRSFARHFWSAVPRFELIGVSL